MRMLPLNSQQLQRTIQNQSKQTYPPSLLLILQTPPMNLLPTKQSYHQHPRLHLNLSSRKLHHHQKLLHHTTKPISLLAQSQSSLSQVNPSNPPATHSSHQFLCSLHQNQRPAHDVPLQVFQHDTRTLSREWGIMTFMHSRFYEKL